MTPELRAACARALHVLTRSGTLHVGHRGVLFVGQQLGYGAWVAPFEWPPLSWAAALGYRVVANNRRRFAPFLFRGERSRDS